MKWRVRFTVRGTNNRDDPAILEMLSLLGAIGKTKHFSFTGWEPKRR